MRCRAGDWDFTIRGALDKPVSWTWEELLALPSETVTVDIHCVTKWSKLDTVWKGVSLDTLLEGVETSAEYVLAFCDGGYTTNLPLEDVTGGKAWVAYEYGGEPLEPEHGGPARLLVPHLYFWKSAKWVRGLSLAEHDASFLMAFCDGGYTTNLPLEDVTDGKAWVAYTYEGEPLDPEHGGPARLLVPHLYFWKSAKWVRRLDLRDEDEPGFWESNGYHLCGDPWLEQRYWGD